FASSSLRHEVLKSGELNLMGQHLSQTEKKLADKWGHFGEDFENDKHLSSAQFYSSLLGLAGSAAGVVGVLGTGGVKILDLVTKSVHQKQVFAKNFLLGLSPYSLFDMAKYSNTVEHGAY